MQLPVVTIDEACVCSSDRVAAREFEPLLTVIRCVLVFFHVCYKNNDLSTLKKQNKFLFLLIKTSKF